MEARGAEANQTLHGVDPMTCIRCTFRIPTSSHGKPGIQPDAVICREARPMPVEVSANHTNIKIVNFVMFYFAIKIKGLFLVIYVANQLCPRRLAETSWHDS